MNFPMAIDGDVYPCYYPIVIILIVEFVIYTVQWKIVGAAGGENLSKRSFYEH